MMDLNGSLTYRLLASNFGDFYMDRYSVTFLQKFIKGEVVIIVKYSYSTSHKQPFAFFFFPLLGLCIGGFA